MHGEPTNPFEAVALVASLGGLPAISAVLAALPAHFPAHVLVLQHGPRHDDPDRLTRILRHRTALPVGTARPGTPLDRPGVTVVPTGHLADVDADRRIALSPAAAAPVTASSVHGGDTLLTGLAGAFGPRTIGVVLTGMLHDGAQGARAVKRHGGRVLVQDPATARAPGMPASTIATGCVDFVLPLHRIAPALIALAMAPGAAELFTVPTPPWARLHA